jgi:hypothetical protein
MVVPNDVLRFESYIFLLLSYRNFCVCAILLASFSGLRGQSPVQPSSVFLTPFNVSLTLKH